MIKINNSIIFLILLFFIIITRLPYLNYVEFSWDEATYLLAGKDFLYGNLPYLDNTENKPFFAYLPFFLASVFDNSVLAIRLIGLILILITSIIIFITLSNNLKIEKIISLIFSILFIFFCSDRFGQWIGTEIIVLPFISMLIFLLTSNNINNKKIILAGLVASSCVLIRTSLFTLPIITAIFLLNFSSIRKSINNIFILSLSGFSLPLLIFILYSFYDGGIRSLYEHVIILNISYINYSDLIVPTIEFLKTILESQFSFTFLASFYLAFYIFSKKNRDRKVLSWLLIALIISVFLPGKGYDHYLLQIFPIIIISSAILCNDIYVYSNRSYKLLTTFTFLFSFYSIIILPMHIKSDLYDHNSQIVKNNYLELKKYIDKEDNVFIFDNSILYVLLEKKPPTPVLHVGLFRFYNDNQLNLMKFNDRIIKNEIARRKMKEKYFLYANKSAKTRDKELERILNLKLDWLIINRENYDKFINDSLKEFINQNWILSKELDNKVLVYKLKN